MADFKDTTNLERELKKMDDRFQNLKITKFHGKNGQNLYALNLNNESAVRALSYMVKEEHGIGSNTTDNEYKDVQKTYIGDEYYIVLTDSDLEKIEQKEVEQSRSYSPQSHRSQDTSVVLVEDTAVFVDELKKATGIQDDVELYARRNKQGETVYRLSANTAAEAKQLSYAAFERFGIESNSKPGNFKTVQQERSGDGYYYIIITNSDLLKAKKALVDVDQQMEQQRESEALDTSLKPITEPQKPVLKSESPVQASKTMKEAHKPPVHKIILQEKDKKDVETFKKSANEVAEKTFKDDPKAKKQVQDTVNKLTSEQLKTVEQSKQSPQTEQPKTTQQKHKKTKIEGVIQWLANRLVDAVRGLRGDKIADAFKKDLDQALEKHFGQEKSHGERVKQEKQQVSKEGRTM